MSSLKSSNRMWVVGNGPSLWDTPLELLKDEVTFACNRIHLLYDSTDWRPTYYVRHEVDDKDWKDVTLWHIEQDYQCFVSTPIAQFLATCREPVWPVTNLITIKTACLHTASNFFRGRKPEAWHLPSLCCFASTVFVSLQIAVLEQLRLPEQDRGPIFVIGCDLGYKKWDKKNEDDPNHFDPRYGEFDQFPLEERDPTLTYGHQIAKESAATYGIEIFNAGVGGELEVYPRVDIAEVLSG